MKNFRPKKVKILDFELQKRYIPQKKAKIMYNSDSARKSTIVCKKNIFFRIFRFSRYDRCWLKILGRPVFQNFQKKNPKNGLTRTWQMLKGTKS